MKEKIEFYLKDKELAWSPTTLKSVRSTLTSLLPFLNGDPRALWNHLEAKHPYTRVTLWWRVCGFWDFVGGRNGNPYREFRFRNARLFKDKYVRKTPSISIEETKERIASIENKAISKKAMELLLSGMRWSESFTYEDGWITGKGGIKRQVFLPKIDGPEYKRSYRTFLRALQDVGLKPHDLRKINLTECVRSGANIFELQKMAGWKNLETAKSYISVLPDRLKEISERVRMASDGRRKDYSSKVPGRN